MTRPAGGRAHRRGIGRSVGVAGAAPRHSHPPDRADEPAERNPWYRHLGWPVLVAMGGIGALLIGGVPAWRAVVISIAAAVTLWGVIVSMSVPRVRWPYDLPYEVYRVSFTWEVPGLVGAQQSAESFQYYLRPRLWSLASELLRRRGIDPDSDRAAALVGRREYALLTGADTDPARCTSSIPVLCHVIARLAVQPAGDSPPPLRNPALAGLAGRPGRPDRRGRPDLPDSARTARRDVGKASTKGHFR